MMMRAFLLCMLLLLFQLLPAQSWEIEAVVLHGLSSPKTEQKLAKKLRSTQDSLQILPILDDWQEQLLAAGRLEASIDRVVHRKDSLLIWLHEGAIYYLDSLEIEGLGASYWQKSGLEKWQAEQIPFNWQRLEGRFQYILQLYQDEGYPFAKFEQEEVLYVQDSARVKLRLKYAFDAGELVKIDSILIQGKHREKDAFVYSLIRLSPDEAYNQGLIDDIPRILNNSIYYKNVKAAKVEFSPFNTAKLRLKLTPQRSSKFDLLLGLLPPQQETQKFQFTGLLNFELVSPLKFGEVISFRYERLPQVSQKVEASYLQPYLFGTPFKVEGEFYLLKQDTTFLNRHFEATGHYAISHFLSVQFYYRTKGTTLLAADQFRNSAELPDILDGNTTTYGAGIRYEKVDYRLNPTKGIILAVRAGLGRRRIKRNPILPKELYDAFGELDLPSREVDVRVQWFQRVFKRQVLYVANHTYWLGQSDYFVNDQLQVGGSRSIRGFNENELFTDFYSFFTAEYRLLLERDSYIFVFGDYARLRNELATPKISHPFGLGLGMAYATKAGVISISYAIGKVGEQAIQPGRGKIHIGLVNQF